MSARYFFWAVGCKIGGTWYYASKAGWTKDPDRALVFRSPHECRVRAACIAKTATRPESKDAEPVLMVDAAVALTVVRFPKKEGL